jgi:hypothetical protein
MDYKVKFKINKLFNLDDYKVLNKDLKQICKTNEEYITHYKTKGVFEGRLINKEQLKIVNEFGNECVLYIPYFYYLYKNGLLFDNVIETYQGMQPYYIWCPKENVKFENKDKRHWTKYILENNPINWNPFPYNNLVYNQNEHCNEYNENFMKCFDYKGHYKKFDPIIKFDNDKPIVIICNKICKEWGLYPINFYKVDELKILFDLLLPKYNIIYSCNTPNISDYSYDGNDNQEISKDFNELEFLNDIKYEDVIVFETFIKLFKYDYNKTKLITYAHCNNFITVQGGNSHLVSYFFKNMFVLHKHGNEIQENLGINTYKNWYKKMNTEDNKNIFVENNFENLFIKIKETLIGSETITN